MEISSTYNDRAFVSMGYLFDDGCWIKKASYKPKVKTTYVGGSRKNIPDGAQSIAFSSLMSDVQDIKQSLGAAVGDLHKCNESMAILISDMANLKKQMTHIQHEGVESFNKGKNYVVFWFVDGWMTSIKYFGL
ncbi:hypothetical protein HAX54_027387 [Datura stramonium]|uniref:Uncharacterized protein n=1 Tax=Datura stramonium TaxID=4076 RepID=A0ABS8S8P3_DATST|nr:hypothetical protein [Datura stramonium]